MMKKNSVVLREQSLIYAAQRCKRTRNHLRSIEHDFNQTNFKQNIHFS